MSGERFAQPSLDPLFPRHSPGGVEYELEQRSGTRSADAPASSYKSSLSGVDNRDRLCVASVSNSASERRRSMAAVLPRPRRARRHWDHRRIPRLRVFVLETARKRNSGSVQHARRSNVSRAGNGGTELSFAGSPWRPSGSAVCSSAGGGTDHFLAVVEPRAACRAGRGRGYATLSCAACAFAAGNCASPRPGASAHRRTTPSS